MTNKTRLMKIGMYALIGILLNFMVSVLVLLTDTRTSHFLVRNSYDWSFLLAPSRIETLKDSPVVIVYLDLFSYERENQNPALPWSRALHAELLNRLKADGARAVIFDIIFSDPGPDPVADEKFTQAIGEFGDVVLAAELNISSRDTGKGQSAEFSQLVLPYEPFLNAAAGWGIAQTKIDEDFTVREIFPGFPEEGKPSLTWTAAKLLGLEAADEAVFPLTARWINYYGRPRSIPHVNYSQALRNEETMSDFFRNKVVLVGALPKAGSFDEVKDEFRSPFAFRDDASLFMPGVEVHATQLLNLIRHDWLTRLSLGLEILALFLSAAALGLVLLPFRPFPAAGIAVLAEGATIAAFIDLFHVHQLWFPWLIVCGVQIPTALGWNWATRSIQWYVQRRKLEEARRVAQIKIQEQARLIDEAHDAIVVLDQDQRVRFWNRSAENLYGWTVNEALGQSAAGLGLFEKTNQFSQILAEFSDRGQWVGELDQTTKSGRKVIALSSWTLVETGAGANGSILIINTDITEKKKLEEQFLRAQRMEAIGNLAGGMVHDLNNTLSPILLGIQRLKKKTTEGDARHMLEVMESNTHRGAEMIKQILTFSRGYDTTQHQVDLRTILDDLVKIIRETFPKSIQIDLIVPDDLWTVAGSPTQIHQVVLNLCINARDAMPDGGEILIAADNVELSSVEAASIPEGRPGRFATVIVTDNGPGIPKDQIAKIFDPFFTTKAPGAGTGLGLSTCKAILGNHQGFIQVKSEFGEGASFEIFLPKAAGEKLEPTTEPHFIEINGDGRIILLADDEQAVREMMKSILEDCGFQVIPVGNGIEALAARKNSMAKIDLAILDLEMPDLDGRRTAGEMLRADPRLPILFISGELAGTPALRLSESKLIPVLQKPFTSQELLSRIDDILQKKK